MEPRFRLTLTVVATACLALVATGCSKSTAGPSVAQLTTPTASAPSSAASSDSSPGSSSPPSKAAALLAYSQCMRSHGVPDFPDPVDGGLEIRASKGSDLDPTSPQFAAAQKACQSLLPNGGKAGPVSTADQAKALKYSECMRANGVPNFPDPTFSGGGVQLKVTNIDPNSPQFATAQKACGPLQPIGGRTNNSGP